MQRQHGARLVYYSMDSGAIISCISQDAYKCDHAMLRGAGDKLIKLKEPMRLDVFTESGSVVAEIVMGVEFQIGDGHQLYSLMLDYLLGSTSWRAIL